MTQVFQAEFGVNRKHFRIEGGGGEGGGDDTGFPGGVWC